MFQSPNEGVLLVIALFTERAIVQMTPSVVHKLVNFRGKPGHIVFHPSRLFFSNVYKWPETNILSVLICPFIKAD